MKIKISAFDAITRTVEVLFTEGKIKHTRTVNACLTAAGEYDKDATAERVADVARGVAAKIAAGVIS